MADTKDEIELELVNINETAPSNKYDAHVAKLVAADAKLTDKQRAEGTHNALWLEFPKLDEKGKPAIERYKRWFRESAAAHNVSAKVTAEQDNGDSIKIRYVVVEKIVRPRKPKTVDAPETADAPETVQETTRDAA